MNAPVASKWYRLGRVDTYTDETYRDIALAKEKLSELDPIIGKFKANENMFWWKCYLLNEQDVIFLRLQGIKLIELTTAESIGVISLGTYTTIKSVTSHLNV